MLEKVAETAGLLWTEADITAEITETIREYSIIKSVSALAPSGGFVNYKASVETLRTAITTTNKLPKDTILTSFPALSGLLSGLLANNANDIKEALEQNPEIVSALFFDPKRKKTIEILKQNLGDMSLPEDNVLLGIYNTRTGGYAQNQSAFFDSIRSEIEISAKQSVANKIKAEWNRISDEDTPDSWAYNNGFPAKYIFSGISETAEILSAVSNSSMFSSDRLEQLLDLIKMVSTPTISEVQERFLKDIIPKRFSKLNISLASLIVFLKDKYGSQPNNWSQNPNIDDFIRSQYKGAFAPQITEKIKGTSAEELKAKILTLALDNPDLGLMFWE